MALRRLRRSRAVFLDKDGTLVEDVPYNVDPDRIRLTPRAEAGLGMLHRGGFRPAAGAFDFCLSPLDPAHLTPPYWINMGAMAISTLAGAGLVANASHSQLIRDLLPFLVDG